MFTWGPERRKIMKDYLVLKDWEADFLEVLLFEDYLTNGDIQRIEAAVQHTKDTVDEYTNDDIKEAVCEVKPYSNCLTLSNAHTIEY